MQSPLWMAAPACSQARGGAALRPAGRGPARAGGHTVGAPAAAAPALACQHQAARMLAATPAPCWPHSRHWAGARRGRNGDDGARAARGWRQPRDWLANTQREDTWLSWRLSSRLATHRPGAGLPCGPAGTGLRGPDRTRGRARQGLCNPAAVAAAHSSCSTQSLQHTVAAPSWHRMLAHSRGRTGDWQGQHRDVGARPATSGQQRHRSPCPCKYSTKSTCAHQRRRPATQAPGLQGTPLTRQGWGCPAVQWARACKEQRRQSHVSR